MQAAERWPPILLSMEVTPRQGAEVGGGAIIWRDVVSTPIAKVHNQTGLTLRDQNLLDGVGQRVTWRASTRPLRLRSTTW
jgi:hypothetical protein